MLDLGRVISGSQFSTDARRIGFTIEPEANYEQNKHEPPPLLEPEEPLSLYEEAHSDFPAVRRRASKLVSEMPVILTRYQPYGTQVRGIACGIRGTDPLEERASIGVVEKDEEQPAGRPNFTSLKDLGDAMGKVADNLEVSPSPRLLATKQHILFCTTHRRSIIFFC